VGGACILIANATLKRLDKIQEMWRKESDFGNDDLSLQFMSKGCWNKSIAKFPYGAT
jgi:hypothetical protein